MKKYNKQQDNLDNAFRTFTWPVKRKSPHHRALEMIKEIEMKKKGFELISSGYSSRRKDENSPYKLEERYMIFKKKGFDVLSYIQRNDK